MRNVCFKSVIYGTLLSKNGKADDVVNFKCQMILEIFLELKNTSF